MKRAAYHRGYHLAPLCNAAGEQVNAADVLDAEEQHDRHWGIPPRREPVADPALVSVVAALQVSAK